MRMRDCGNDLKIEVDPQSKRDGDRRMPEAVKGAKAQMEAGYTTLDQASTGPYSDKERRGLSREADYPRRY